MPSPQRLRRLPTASLPAGLMLAFALGGCATQTPVDTPAAVQRAESAMGGVGLKTLRFASKGTGGVFGQAYRPDMPWPLVTYSSFTRVMDYENAALREDFARSRAEPLGGGAIPLMGTGEQRATGLVMGSVAWNLAGTAASAAPVAMETRVHDLWTTPHGVLKAALKNQARAVQQSMDGKPYTALSFTEPGRFSATAFINSDNLVERVDSRHPNPVMGDTEVVTRYSGYKDFGGVKFPTRILQTEGGHPVLDLEVTDVQANQATGISVPDNVRSFKENAAAEKVADGVWFIAGGSHNSVAIEMKDHMVLVESPLYDGRAQAVLDTVRGLVPGKPIQLVINSHHHFDHAGGLRTAVANGLPLLTSAQAKPYFERILANPNSLNPDRLAQSGRKASIEGVSGKRVLTDGSRSIEVYEMQDSVHAQGFMMVYLPKEKLLIEADAYTPGAPNAPTPNPINGNNQNLVSNMDRNRLAVDRILPLHGRVVNVAELMTAVGRK